ncbi:Rup1p KNAG_0B04050 [Huiozyma naganishii CBS 8797]|uniref:UBA domain-containing protein n=1 Tax=Huiozyma naganishii (strain ATCC MYA-139 / BCRC 22969 / CBS 8797 / KCTC 17520 / NBRC 10181 / NCYC 3082 / Yp74L-3) TaxID=1071383 RepID=J7RH27_HUIN7|nr:hypothetical protein KNAG_0B04050 [Kazachstania naganishii CBS 8797]CCK68843.1 hypothetical protein KNAG_0B04050 [Kazachstania naganishii CBS 8797]
MGEEQDAVASLGEMGIPEDVALDALRRANGNLSAAVNYIFSNDMPAGEHVELPQPRESSDLKPGDLDQVLRESQRTGPQLNQLVQLDSHPAADTNDEDTGGNIYLDEDDNIEVGSVQLNEVSPATSIPPNSDIGSSPDDGTGDPPEYGGCKVPAAEEGAERPDSGAAPAAERYATNYLVLFAFAVATYAPLQFVQQDFKNLNYDAEWYAGDAIQQPLCIVSDVGADGGSRQIVPEEEVTSDTPVQPEMLWQLQRVISVCHSKLSERSYVSAKVFTKVFDTEVESCIRDSDHLYEALPSFIKSIIRDAEMCPAQHSNTDVKSMFLSSAIQDAEQGAEPEETFLFLFHFPPEEYNANLYKMFNALLYPEDDTIDDNSSDTDSSNDTDVQVEGSLKELAPLLTIIFNEADPGQLSAGAQDTCINSPQGVEVPFSFYPQLYTREVKEQVVKPILRQRKAARAELRQCLARMNQLKSYEGKGCCAFLEQYAEVLAGRPCVSAVRSRTKNEMKEVIQKVTSIKLQLNEERAKLKKQYVDLSNKLQNEWNISNPERKVIGEAKRLGLLDKPHLLSMVVLSPYFYLMRDSSGGSDWTLVQSNSYGTDGLITKHVTEEKVQQYIRDCTKTANDNPLMFIYCREDFFVSQEETWSAIEKNMGCSEFNKADQLYLLTHREDRNE